jgi:hypothetical protein
MLNRFPLLAPYARLAALLLALILALVPLALLPQNTQAAEGVDSFTKLLIHADGPDASTTFTDSSPSGRAVTTNGNAQVDTAQSKFGGASLLLDGSGDYLQLAANSDWDLGAAGGSDFTIDFWVRFNTETVTQMRMLSAETGNGWALYMHDNSTISAWTASGPVDTRWTWDPVAGTWYHVALVRTGGVFKLFINGTSLGDGTDRDMTTSAALAIGRADSGTGEFGALNGWMDEVRVSKGIARWTSNFTPPQLPYGQVAIIANVNVASNLDIRGSISKGSGTFVIDHPLRPRTHLLYHSFVESPEAKNIYDGVARLDENGEAIIKLPEYFQALNESFRYQFFPIGRPMPNLHIKAEIRENQFVITGGEPHGTISWQVSGVRRDPYIQANPIRVEVQKGPNELVDRGEYIFPEYEQYQTHI